MTTLNPWADRRVLATDPDHIPDSETWMELKLTYAGLLLGSNRGDTRARHKHDIRKKFHVQLKRFWELHPYLKDSHEQGKTGVWEHQSGALMAQTRAEKFSRNGYRFAPLATMDQDLHCSLSILFLRPDVPGGVLKSADIDNRLKTLFDALRMPHDKDELGGHVPAEGEDPFFCLLQDDSLISNVSVETDMLLEDFEGRYDANHARLVITAHVRPYAVSWQNINFS